MILRLYQPTALLGAPVAMGLARRAAITAFRSRRSKKAGEQRARPKIVRRTLRQVEQRAHRLKPTLPARHVRLLGLRIIVEQSSYPTRSTRP